MIGADDSRSLTQLCGMGRHVKSSRPIQQPARTLDKAFNGIGEYTVPRVVAVYVEKSRTDTAVRDLVVGVKQFPAVDRGCIQKAPAFTLTCEAL